MTRVPTYSLSEISTAFNRAADDVIGALDLPDTGARDLVNLVVNAGFHYVEDTCSTLDEAIAENYEPDEHGHGPLDWIEKGLA